MPQKFHCKDYLLGCHHRSQVLIGNLNYFVGDFSQVDRVHRRFIAYAIKIYNIIMNQILCDLHFADVALMECSDFMQQLRSFKPQSLGCAVARRKSSTTLIFPLPPQACSGMC
uniref:Uncharacterized protein n=1 Tax=Glossina pallidipes TaxID=7398 RepID=A0A1A9ZEE7_GLOPL